MILLWVLMRGWPELRAPGVTRPSSVMPIPPSATLSVTVLSLMVEWLVPSSSTALSSFMQWVDAWRAEQVWGATPLPVIMLCSMVRWEVSCASMAWSLAPVIVACLIVTCVIPGPM